MKVAIHIEDSRYNGIRPSHFDGIRMVCDVMAVEALEYIDLTEDGFQASGGHVRHATFNAFVATHPSDTITLLDPDGTRAASVDGWLVVGPSGGHSAAAKETFDALRLPNPGALEGRDALVIALAGL